MESSGEATGRGIAIAAQCLYLCNLLLLPLIAFLLLLMLAYHHKAHPSELARSHLSQALNASIWAGLLLLPPPAILLAAVGWESPAAWTLALLYCVTLHAALVLAGALALARALSTKTYRYPMPWGWVVW